MTKNETAIRNLETLFQHENNNLSILIDQSQNLELEAAISEYEEDEAAFEGKWENCNKIR